MQRIEHKIIDGVEHKWCGRCKRWLPLDCFCKNKAKWDGLQERCSECKAEHHQKKKGLYAGIREGRRMYGNVVEQWRNCTENPNYEVSSFGRVRNKSTLLVREQVRSKNGYMTVMFNMSGKNVLFYVHRLIASAFIDNHKNLETVNHKDHNRQNNCIWNLEWCSNKENVQHGVGMKIYAYDANHTLVGSFKSLRDTEKYFSISHGRITQGGYLDSGRDINGIYFYSKQIL